MALPFSWALLVSSTRCALSGIAYLRRQTFQHHQWGNHRRPTVGPCHGSQSQHQSMKIEGVLDLQRPCSKCYQLFN